MGLRLPLRPGRGVLFGKIRRDRSACGYEVCQVMGASIPEEGWQRIKRLLETPDPSNHASPVPATGEAVPPLQSPADGLPASKTRLFEEGNVAAAVKKTRKELLKEPDEFITLSSG